MALGAQARDVFWLILGSGLRLTLLGSAIGLFLSVLVAFGLRAVFGDEGEFDYAALLVVTAVLLGVADEVAGEAFATDTDPRDHALKPPASARTVPRSSQPPRRRTWTSVNRLL